MHDFNGSKETYDRKIEESKMHSPSSPCEKLSLRIKENTSMTEKLLQPRSDRIRRTKFFHTCLLYMAIGFQGWIKGLIGPVSLDLQRITGTGQAEYSWLITTYFAGQMVAAPIGGILHKKANSMLTMAIAHVGAALAVCCIPWSSLFPLMVTSFLFLGLFLGAADTIANTEIFYIWKGKGKILVQGLDLVFAFAGVLSPLLTAPFLLPPDDLSCGNTTVNNTVYINNQHMQSTTTENYVSNTESNIRSTDIVRFSSTYHCSESKQSSHIFIPFSITGAIPLTVAVGFFTLFCKSMSQNYVFKKSYTEQDLKTTNKTLSKFTKYGAIFALSVILLVSSGLDYGYNTFLVSFLVKQMNWTKSMGSTLTSLVFLLDVVGRVFCLFLIRFILPEILIVFHCIVSVIVCSGLLVSAIINVNIGIWIFGSLFGYARSIMFPTVFVWANERLFPVTGQITSVFLIACGFGIIINPVIMGYTMEHFSDLWFTYVLLGESILLLGVCVISLVMTKILVTRTGTPNEQ